MITGTDGNLYGTTANGGASNDGTIFRVSPGGAFATLYSFTGNFDGAHPYSGLIQAADGSFYGTTSTGGSFSFSSGIPGLSPWLRGLARTSAHIHRAVGGDEERVHTGGCPATDGNLYAAHRGRRTNGNGVIYQLTPANVFVLIHVQRR